MRQALFTILFGAVFLAGGSGCKRIESKLERLARAAGINQTERPAGAAASAEPALSPEQVEMERQLQDQLVFEAANPEDLAPKAEPFELNKSAVVAILGYHDFRERGGSPMIISAPKFREQMQAVKDSGIPVIPLSDVVAWRKGEKNIPEECFVITMDDGWEGVYELAYPVLKEFGFPFTIYLYKKYVNIGGRSLNWAEIKEMLQHGCDVGSHSVSHESLRQKKGRSDAEHHAWVLAELKDSKEFLEQNLGISCTSFAYPFGIFDDSIGEAARQVGYQTAVTVNSQKVTWDTPMTKLGRYIIHGESDANFKLATSFRGRGDIASSNFLLADARNDEGQRLIQLKPVPDELIADRRPVITVNLQRIETIVPDSVRMRVGGLGTVPALYDPATMTVSYQLPYKLRRQDCSVTVSFKRDPAQPAEVVQWRFKVDLAASYLPSE